MSHAFRTLLRKVGSGTHTRKDLSRDESADATRMMLLQEATPAQIGAFMIAHRIKRPTAAEVAGILDAYDELGPKLPAIASPHPVLVFGVPYDGRDRTVPLSILTALILAAAGYPTLQHGGGIMPTKEGVPLVTIWQGLGVDWTTLSLSQVHQVLQTTGLGFIYLPTHFPLAQSLVPYREQIGKRPPFATAELVWCPYEGNAHVVIGFVHPPTEGRLQDAIAIRGNTHLYTTVKGLEGSCDLPRERTAIIGLGQPLVAEPERLHLHPHDYGFAGKNVPLDDTAEAIAAMQTVLQGQPSELRQSILWNAGFYLWRCGAGATMEEAIALAAELLDNGKASQKLAELCTAVTAACLVPQ